MATENQLHALESWLKKEIPAGMKICEMPGDVCSDALDRLHDASEEYKKDNKKYGIVKKVKQEIVTELKEQGYIDVRIGVDDDIETKAEQSERAQVAYLHSVTFGDGADKEREQKEPEDIRFGKRVKDEVQRIREEQGLGPNTVEEEKEPEQTTVTELIEKYLDILVKVTHVVKINDGISEREKGYATNWICDAVKEALEKGGAHEE